MLYFHKSPKVQFNYAISDVLPYFVNYVKSYLIHYSTLRPYQMLLQLGVGGEMASGDWGTELGQMSQMLNI